MKKSSFWREVFSENGIGSSKRILGSIMILVSLGLITYLVITEGGTSTVDHLLDTTIIVAASLLGISSITSIWKKPKDPEVDEEKDNIEQV